MAFDHQTRIDRLVSSMREEDVDAVLLSVGPDLLYLTGYETMASERLTMLVVTPEGAPTLFVPRLEAPRVQPGPFEVVAWDETDDPVAMSAKLVAGGRRLAIGDHTWAGFVLALQEAIPQASWIPASRLTRDLRMRKDLDEVAALRETARQADRVAARIPEEIVFEGATEQAVSRRIGEMLLEEGHDTFEFGIVASGPNGASPHHDASDRVMGPGDMVVVDFGGRRSGYFSDTTRTFVVGDPSTRQSEIHAVVTAAQEAARTAVKPRATCESVDRAARSVIEDAGFGELFVHRTGHGIGLEVHEHPYIVTGNTLALEPRMAFSIEPGVYVPDELGVRIEDIVVVTDDGAESLNRSPRALLPVR